MSGAKRQRGRASRFGFKKRKRPRVRAACVSNTHAAEADKGWRIYSSSTLISQIHKTLFLAEIDAAMIILDLQY
ncbi:hypothetical protein yfred0001_5680 [Yersinia frederiksenii ATCC 33641]|nr:hypothetical protein yfred0001_5680 [Yersinia frederiksenii ATCC 33641]